MLEILAIALPIFLLIGAGFIAARTALLSRDNLQGVGSFVMYLALPSLIIRAPLLIPRPPQAWLWSVPCRTLGLHHQRMNLQTHKVSADLLDA